METGTFKSTHSRKSVMKKRDKETTILATKFIQHITPTLSIVLVIGMMLLATGCHGNDTPTAEAFVTDTGASPTEYSHTDVTPRPMKYGILIDMTSSVPEEQGTNLVSSVIDAISLPELQVDLNSGASEIPERQFAIAFVDKNPLDSKKSQKLYYSWVIPGVDALDSEPDASDPNVTYDTYDNWTAAADIYKSDYQKCLTTTESMKVDLRNIDLKTIRKKATASGIPASFDKLIRSMALDDGDIVHLIVLSDLETNSDVSITPLTGVKGEVYGIISNYGMSETEESIQAFNEFIAAYGFSDMKTYRPEATEDAIRSWLSS